MCLANKLHVIKPFIRYNRSSHVLTRQEMVVSNRLRVGHTRITHSHLLCGDDQPECTICQSPLTVKHFVTDYTNFSDVWKKYFVASTFKELFENVKLQNILSFIKDIHFYLIYFFLF